MPLPTRRLLLACWSAALLAGCPPNLQPPTPDGGRACTANVDCNPSGETCGELYLCVQQLCEATPSQVIPCPGSGMRP